MKIPHPLDLNMKYLNGQNNPIFKEHLIHKSEVLEP